MNHAFDDRLEAVRGRIARACEAAGRDLDEVTLIAVTKTQPDATVRGAIDAGLLDLAENRVQELTRRLAVLEGPEAGRVRWHLVGRLQRNKVKDVVGRVALIHSIDREELVDRVAAVADAAGIVQRVLIQVNVGDDPAKGGCSLDRLEELVTYASGPPAVDVVGLMTVPPLPPPGGRAEDTAAPCFRRLREERDRLRVHFPGLEELSMGMSDDLEVAVREGATMVRIGSALFGQRAEVA
jgi:pyridoxal phosphate enzyme (YggS family)